MQNDNKKHYHVNFVIDKIRTPHRGLNLVTLLWYPETASE